VNNDAHQTGKKIIPAIMKKVAILFARKNSIYKTFKICDVYDSERDALTFKGNLPVIAHPPCRAWGSLRHFSKPDPGEKDLAVWAVGVIRNNGGALEHPRGSTLWKTMDLPKPGNLPDKFGGFSILIRQFDFGHKADKATWLYVCGISPYIIPPIPRRFGEPTQVIATSRNKRGSKPELGKAQREHTPVNFAKWLIKLALLAKHKNREDLYYANQTGK
jgi:hypothetical protein